MTAEAWCSRDGITVAPAVSPSPTAVPNHVLMRFRGPPEKQILKGEAHRLDRLIVHPRFFSSELCRLGPAAHLGTSGASSTNKDPDRTDFSGGGSKD
ncbi:hypothetical protein Cadr_000026458 [Camelus dromedarius]|uniref:Uncharacterized protein n=1 Tax=Camelus dromedarius TaxID=9838 RepID=A0A5N4CF43_CAMDR|nr:hypothetical protein Cadr_000026458 [Camelus dromedarius]